MQNKWKRKNKIFSLEALFLEISSLKFFFKYTCTYLTNFDKNKLIKQIITIIQVKVKKRKHSIIYFHLKYYFRKNFKIQWVHVYLINSWSNKNDLIIHMIIFFKYRVVKKCYQVLILWSQLLWSFSRQL